MKIRSHAPLSMARTMIALRPELRQFRKRSCSYFHPRDTMALPVFTPDITDAEKERMMENACNATNFLKAISHEGRLMILCHLASGEKSVTDLEELISARQAAVSQQLSRLRQEGLVKPRRDGKTIYYRLSDDRAVKVLDVVYELFCKQD